MGIIWQKVWSDLWDDKMRTILAVLSITAGVFAVGAIFDEANHLLFEVDAAHQVALLSYINITLQEPIGRDTTR